MGYATTNSFYQNQDATTDRIYQNQVATTDTDATTNDAITKSFYQNQDATMDTDATTNSFYESEAATTNAGGILSADVARACA